ncbi:hypothetical protein NB706_003003 [Xanthomonas sacchari]|nr:hypothetical protein [Xanthomonas sacchari]
MALHEVAPGLAHALAPFAVAQAQDRIAPAVHVAGREQFAADAGVQRLRGTADVAGQHRHATGLRLHRDPAEGFRRKRRERQHRHRVVVRRGVVDPADEAVALAVRLGRSLRLQLRRVRAVAQPQAVQPRLLRHRRPSGFQQREDALAGVHAPAVAEHDRVLGQALGGADGAAAFRIRAQPLHGHRVVQHLHQRLRHAPLQVGLARVVRHREEARGQARDRIAGQRTHRRRAVAEQRDRDAQHASGQQQRPVFLAEVADQPVRPAAPRHAQQRPVAVRVQHVAEVPDVHGDAAAAQFVGDQAALAGDDLDLMADAGQRLRQRHEMGGRAGVFGIGADEQEFHPRRSS